MAATYTVHSTYFTTYEGVDSQFHMERDEQRKEYINRRDPNDDTKVLNKTVATLENDGFYRFEFFVYNVDAGMTEMEAEFAEICYNNDRYADRRRPIVHETIPEN